MEIYNKFEEIEFNKDTVLTVGTFDGVHKGHQTIIHSLISIASKDKLRHMLITFHPHPQIVLKSKGKEPICLLTTMEERINLFRHFGIENLLIIPFDYKFSQTPPESFIQDFLIKKIGMKKILIGYDHVFGRNRGGGFELLERMGLEQDFIVERMHAEQNQETIISSTKIRDAVRKGLIEEANNMLGYDYLYSGIVVHGDRRGRTIGFPTANITSRDENKLMPGMGVYSVSVKIENKTLFGMANIGTRPTFYNNNKVILEVNIFDFDDDIYNSSIQVNFHNFIRTEKRFGSKEELISQLKNDEEKCRNLQKNFNK